MPVGAVTVMVPVDPPQEGWVTETEGVEGIGLAAMVALVPDDIHPSAFFALTVYDPMATEENTPDVLV